MALTGLALIAGASPLVQDVDKGQDVDPEEADMARGGRISYAGARGPFGFSPD